MKTIILANVIIFLLKLCKAENFINHLEKSLDVRHCLAIIASENFDRTLNIQDLKSPNILLNLTNSKGIKEASKTCKKHLILLGYQSRLYHIFVKDLLVKTLLVRDILVKFLLVRNLTCKKIYL